MLWKRDACSGRSKYLEDVVVFFNSCSRIRYFPPLVWKGNLLSELSANWTWDASSRIWRSSKMLRVLEWNSTTFYRRGVSGKSGSDKLDLGWLELFRSRYANTMALHKTCATRANISRNHKDISSDPWLWVMLTGPTPRDTKHVKDRHEVTIALLYIFTNLAS